MKAVLAYIAVRGFKEGPLFTDRKGLPFTQQALISSLRTTLTKAGVECTHYSGHSFCIESNICEFTTWNNIIMYVEKLQPN